MLWVSGYDVGGVRVLYLLGASIRMGAEIPRYSLEKLRDVNSMRAG